VIGERTAAGALRSEASASRLTEALSEVLVIPQPSADPSSTLFERRLTVLTFSLLLVALSYHLLRELAGVLQPLLIAGLITYIALPIHKWLVRHGAPPKVAHILLLIGVVIFFYGVGRMAQSNIEDLVARWDDYEEKLDRLLNRVQSNLPFPIPELEGKRIRDFFHTPSVEQMIEPVKSALGSFVGLLTSTFVVILYLVFLAAEVFSFPQRAREAFGPERSEEVMGIISSINHAVGGYLAVMTLINALIGLLTYIVLLLFDIPFAPMWGLLIFLFSYIPYIGSIVVTVALVVLGVIVHSDNLWMVLILALVLVGIQQFFGAYVQPRMMGSRLGVSPLLILLALGFWGSVWGIVGMLLAVPLLMVLKITLQHIPETKPLAMLMSNP
jgi:predicted PurR-regulated permease PerM